MLHGQIVQIVTEQLDVLSPVRGGNPFSLLFERVAAAGETPQAQEDDGPAQGSQAGRRVASPYRDLSNIANYRQAQNQDLHRLGARLAPSPVTFVTIGASFPYEGLLPFESPSYLSGARILWLCGRNQSPVQKKQLADNGIDDLFAELSDGTIPYVVLNQGTVGILKQYLYEHYRKNERYPAHL